MSKSNAMTKDEYIDHEVRIRMLERINQQLISRANVTLMVIITGFLFPAVLKYLGY